MSTYSTKRAREISKFHVAVVQRRLRNVQNSVKTANINLLLLFAVLIVVAVVVANEKYGYDNTLCSFLEIIWKTSLAKKELLNPVVRIF